jgi:type I restriction enzyme, S subunit
MEERELPVGWELASLEQLIGNNGLFSDGDWVESKDQDPVGNIRLLQLADIGDSNFLDKSARFVNDEQYERLRCTEVLEGDILIARMPDPLGRACLVPSLGQRLITVVDVAIVRSGEESVFPQWLMYAINSPAIRERIQLQSTGTTRRRITRKKLAVLEFPLPPLNEQRRIAAKLDTALAAVDACRQRLDGVANLLKRFRQAVLAAATSGELTREWREERGLSTDSWAQSSIIELADQVFDGPFGSNLKSEDYTSVGFRVVRLENISHLRFLEEKRTFISPEKFALLQKHVLFEDDVLFSSFVDEEVRTCLLPSALSGVSINKADCFCIRVNEDLCLPGFVVSVLSCRSTFMSLDGLVHGATRPRINLRQLKSLSIALPPLEEQMEILCRQEQLFSLADQLEARLNTARKVVDRLTPALLAKAYRGELVPQDPSDEPASVLLERIRAAGQAEASASKPSRRGRPKAAAHPAPINRNAAPAPSEPLPPDLLTQLLRECGALSERALLAVSELEPERFEQQLFRELERGTAREVHANGQVLLEAVG